MVTTQIYTSGLLAPSSFRTQACTEMESPTDPSKFSHQNVPLPWTRIVLIDNTSSDRALPSMPAVHFDISRQRFSPHRQFKMVRVFTHQHHKYGKDFTEPCSRLPPLLKHYLTTLPTMPVATVPLAPHYIPPLPTKENRENTYS